MRNAEAAFQIVSLQSLHYLTLSFFVVPLLNIFAEPMSLAYEGGAASVGKLGFLNIIHVLMSFPQVW